MIRSMTGFGRRASQEHAPADAGWTYAFEIKSVNSRHFDLKWRLPLFLRSMEAEWEKLVRKRASRGRIEIFLHLRILRPELLGLSLNRPQARAMLDQLRELAVEYGAGFEPDLNRFLSIPSLWEDDMKTPDPGLLQSLKDGLEGALEDWNRSREGEGEVLAKDLTARRVRLTEIFSLIRSLAPRVKEERCESLRTRIKAVLDKYSLEAEPDRILQETAVLADKLDVSEELTRLSAHLDRLQEILDQGGETGKRLDFTLQECFREINTCGNKAQDAEISKLAVEFKAELEKCREQVQNLE